MKWLLIGFIYFIYCLSVLFTTLLLFPVFITAENWHPVPYGCGVWFYLCVTVFFLVYTLVCIIVLKKVYKMRRRDEDLHNRHTFTINYYSHYICPVQWPLKLMIYISECSSILIRISLHLIFSHEDVIILNFVLY